jgi:Spy/CpxP family protein refolding chaperone
VSPGTPSRGLAAALLLAVFLAGAGAGAAGLALGQRAFGHEGRRGRPLERLSRELDLDAAQRREIRDILLRQRARMRPLFEETRQQIRALLRPDQQARFDALPRPGGRRDRHRKWSKNGSFAP